MQGSYIYPFPPCDAVAPYLTYMSAAPEVCHNMCALVCMCFKCTGMCAHVCVKARGSISALFLNDPSLYDFSWGLSLNLRLPTQLDCVVREFLGIASLPTHHWEIMGVSHFLVAGDCLRLNSSLYSLAISTLLTEPSSEPPWYPFYIRIFSYSGTIHYGLISTVQSQSFSVTLRNALH